MQILEWKAQYRCYVTRCLAWVPEPCRSFGCINSHFEGQQPEVLGSGVGGLCFLGD